MRLPALLLALAPSVFCQSVRIETALGNIDVLLEARRAPATTTNFLRYLDAGAFNGAVFHRTVKMDNQPQSPVKIEVIQGGPDRARWAKDYAPIALERTSQTGLKHVDGAISMARSGPDSATSDFFICIGGQPELDFGGARNPDRQGFAAFGRVTAGMDIVRKIQGQPADGQKLTPPVRIERIRRLP